MRLLSIAMLVAICCQLFSQTYEDEFKTRANLIIRYTAEIYPRGNNGDCPSGCKGDLSDFGKYNYPKILAAYTYYSADDSTQAQKMKARLDVYATKPSFHFNNLALPRLLHTFPNAPGVKENQVEFIKRVFERTDSYNAWTTEGTENHVNMSRLPGYLFAQFALENYPDSFPLAQQRLNEMKEWIEYYSKRAFETGTGEWNSTTYGAYNILPWINIYDFAQDDTVKSMARAILDYYACELAVHYSQALTGGPDMRGNQNTQSFKGICSLPGMAMVWQQPFCHQHQQHRQW
ncbi:MAG: hypothetical protein HC896_05355 [Bacteroidales bacterium]|nr:hypothetical protein [Bacteroidales bacterium]